jgi:DNA polymerase-3 subunit beta
MKITINRQSFLSAFQLVASATSDKTPKPILQNVKLEVTEECSTLIATDLEVSVRVKLEGIESDATGEIMLPVQRMTSILRECSEDKITFKSEDKKMVVKAGKSKFTLVTQDPAEFPAVAQFDSEQYHEIKATAFSQMIQRTLFSADYGIGGRLALAGVLVELRGDEATMVATDGKRLAVQACVACGVGGHAPTGTTVIPTRSTNLIRRALDGMESDVRIAVDHNAVAIQSGGVTLSARLVEGRYPRWRDVFPAQDDSTELELPVGEIHSMFRQAAIVTTDEQSGVDITFGPKTITIVARGADVGDSTTSMDHVCCDEAVKVRVEPNFMIEFLKGLDQSGTFSLRFTDGKTAVVCSDGDDYQYVVMPLSVE